MDIKIAYLKDYQEYVTAVSKWSYDIWSAYEPHMTRKSQIQKFKQHCNIDKLPLTLIALNDYDYIIGMCSLRQNDGIRPDLTPWLTSLYVIAEYRNQKVDEKLINAAKRVARSLGFDNLYLFTFDTKLTHYYANQGWSLAGKDKYNDHPISIMETKLEDNLTTDDELF
jgi:N-acetylglutamate synthase-like GNAT family acetyltransferase